MIETLTEYQRLNLLNQYKILRELAELRNDEDSAKHYDELAIIVSEGYVRDYALLTEELDDEFSKEDCDLVWNTLDLYAAIYFSYKKIANPKIKETDIHFDGFDENEEVRHYHLCKYILLDLNRFGEFTENGRRDFNSHSRRCEIYRSMLDKWEGMGRPYDLSENDIEYLIS